MGIISWTLLIPALGAIFLMFLPSRKSDDEKSSASVYGWLALVISSITMFASIPLVTGFDNSIAGYQFIENVKWIPQFWLNYHVGIDGISILLIMLTTIMMPFTVLSSFKYTQGVFNCQKSKSTNKKSWKSCLRWTFVITSDGRNSHFNLIDVGSSS